MTTDSSARIDPSASGVFRKRDSLNAHREVHAKRAGRPTHLAIGRPPSPFAVSTWANFVFLPQKAEPFFCNPMDQIIPTREEVSPVERASKIMGLRGPAFS